MDSVPTSSGFSSEAVQLQAGVGTRRESRPSFATLEENLSKIEDALDEVISFDFTKIEENAAGANDLASSAKKLIRAYKKISRDMSTFCIKQGSVEEAQKVRDKRTEYVKDIREVLLSINAILSENGADMISNLEVSSTRSGYSLSSPLNFHSPLLSPENVTSPVLEPTSHDPLVDDKLPEQGAASPRTCNVSSATLPTSVQHAHQSSSGAAFQSSTPRTTDSLARVNYPPLSVAGPPMSSSVPGQHYDKSDSCVPFSKPPYSSFNHSNDFLQAGKARLPIHAPKIVPKTSSLNFDPNVSSFIPVASNFKSEQTNEMFKDSSNFSHVNTNVSNSLPSYILSEDRSTKYPYVNHDSVLNLPKFLKPKVSFDPRTSSSHYTGLSDNFNPSDLCMSIMTNHLLERELLKTSIEPFSGKAHMFWPWVGKLEGYIGSLNLSPLKTLHLLETYSTGEPQKMISRQLASTGAATTSDVQEVWDNLIYRYGSSQRITEELLSLIEDFPPVRGEDKGSQLQDLHDLLRVVLHNQPKCPELAIMDLSAGVRKIRGKLPEFIQNEWRKFGTSYEQYNGGRHPPFCLFVDFIKKQARLLSSKSYENIAQTPSSKRNVRALQTQIETYQNEDTPPEATRSKEPLRESSKSSTKPSPSQRKQLCLYHKSPGHLLTDCRSFRKLPFSERKKFVFEAQVCFLCFGDHRASTCSNDVKCKECGEKHNSAMHILKPAHKAARDPSPPKLDSTKPNSPLKTLCTSVYKSPPKVSYSKTLLVELTMDGVPNKCMRAYCIIDEQSNTSLVDERVVDFFGKEFPTQEYCIKFASQNCEMNTSGSLVTGLKVRGVKEKEVIEVPQALSCASLSDTTSEVATPEIVLQDKQTAPFSGFFPEFDPDAEALILLGRNCGRAMATECLTTQEPYIHKTPLGYALVGTTYGHEETVLEGVSVLKTCVSPPDSVRVRYKFSPKHPNSETFNPFCALPDDDQPGLSIDDKRFLSIMEEGASITSSGSIQLPLPVKKTSLPQNKAPVFMRTAKTLAGIKVHKPKLDACLKSIHKSLQAGFIEEVDPSLPEPVTPCWYLPIFCVQQAKKGKFRLVFDAAARYHGTSLNDVLLTGPDLNNQLRGVLLRFREKPVAFAADIEGMFSNFKVPPEQQDLLRFYWFQKNNPDLPIVTYHSSSHIFGCSSSPAVASYALKFCASHLPPHKQAVKQYIERSFYVDDGIFSAASVKEAVDVLSGAIKCLSQFNMRLHKIVSNNEEVLSHFPNSELATSVSPLPIGLSQAHSTLGINWNTDKDVFVVSASVPAKPFTKRGILSVINSLYDPIGAIAPAVLEGRLIQREILPPKTPESELHQYDWDDHLPNSLKPRWDEWISSLSLLDGFDFPRNFYPLGFSPSRQELHIFSDASVNAIGFVVYMRSLDNAGNVHLSFVTASSRVTPRNATTIPRLELCAAADASKCASSLLLELNTKPSATFFHCDSKVVLGYIYNNTRRFSRYVERRVGTILQNSKQQDWLYVATDLNPADIASRTHSPAELVSSCWFSGPPFLSDPSYDSTTGSFEEIGSLPEEKLSPRTFKTEAVEMPENGVFSTLFSRINSFNKMINTVRIVMKLARRADVAKQRLGVHLAPRSSEVAREEAIMLLVHQAQMEQYPDVLKILKIGNQLPEGHPLSELSPCLSPNGIIRVGGRLKNSKLPFSAKHPILLPKKHPLSLAVVRFYHSQVYHQGSCISHSAVINAGFHIQGGRQLIREFVNKCVVCRKLRAATSRQLMADSPSHRLEETPPFTVIGVDVFGPFFVSNGSATRRTNSSRKIWSAIFVCLPSRAIHLEPLEGMDVSSFRNALARFMAVRGPCKIIYSDQGTNFVCAKKQLDSIDVHTLSSELKTKGIEWRLNPPHASHHAGSWERKIGSVRRVMEAAYALTGNRLLSRDEFSTLLAEASNIVNNTPLWSISGNPNDPSPLTPMMILSPRTDNQWTTPPQDSFTHSDLLAYGQRRYRKVQFLASQFWSRWRSEYLLTLTRRHKWKTKKPCVSVGDVVIIRDRASPRNSWPMGKITSRRVSSDGLVRSVNLVLPPLPGRTQTREVQRPITDLVLLVPSDHHECAHPAS